MSALSLIQVLKSLNKRKINVVQQCLSVQRNKYTYLYRVFSMDFTSLLCFKATKGIEEKKGKHWAACQCKENGCAIHISAHVSTCHSNWRRRNLIEIECFYPRAISHHIAIKEGILQYSALLHSFTSTPSEILACAYEVALYQAKLLFHLGLAWLALEGTEPYIMPQGCLRLPTGMCLE